MPFAHFPEIAHAYFIDRVEQKSSLTKVMARLAALNAAFERPSK
ncbi:MAG: hypothetical protein AAF478_00060 [Pseudomonadota bacterium]